MNDFVIKLPLAMRFYLIGLIYRNSRMSQRLFGKFGGGFARPTLSRFVFGFSIFETDVGMVCNEFGQRRLLDN